jgi:protein-S-isoprenylcysteine O-methyltransferase Ste14
MFLEILHLDMKKILIPPVFLFLSILSILALWLMCRKLNLIKFPYNLGGLVIAFFGFTLMGKTRDQLRNYRTTFAIAESTRLITEGVYRRTRNPMYLGMFLLLLGMAVCFMNILGLLAPFLFLVLIRTMIIPQEEKLLLTNFGQKYTDYKKKTRMWM